MSKKHTNWEPDVRFQVNNQMNKQKEFDLIQKIQKPKPTYLNLAAEILGGIDKSNDFNKR